MNYLNKVPFYKIPISEREIKAVTDQVKSGWLTFGEKTEEFEEKFAKYIGAPYCVMVDNCTAALYLACEYYKPAFLQEEDYITEVSISSLTCAATALALVHAGCAIRFLDLRNDDSFLAQEEEDTLFIIPVHYAGMRQKVSRDAVSIVEDSAHRIVRNGFSDDRQAYSFYSTKNITACGQGGMIACGDKEEANWYKKARLYGNNKAIYERNKMYQTGEKFWWFESEFAGWKADPNDVSAAFGLIQLERLDELNTERKRVAENYNRALGLTTDRFPWHLYPILVNRRDKFMYYMRDNGVSCSVHFPPLHMMEAFKKWSRPLPRTEYVYKHIVSLPLYPYMTEEEQEYVIKLTKEWREKYGKL